jgi:transcriptional regulator with XRE-family HTH domain
MRSAMHLIARRLHCYRNIRDVPFFCDTKMQHPKRAGCYRVPMSPDAHVSPQDTPGAALRALREGRGHGLRAVAEALGVSASKISRIERSVSGVAPEDLDRLLEFYQAPPEVRSTIGALAQQATRRPRESSEALPEAYETYTRFEAEASEISVYAAIVVPGLCQIPEYAAAIIAATPVPEDQFAGVRMETRMKRQWLLGRQPPLRFNVVIDEAVLHRPVGGPEVMHRQRMRLHELSQRPETSIRVLPFAVGAHPALTGQFAILDFPDEANIPPRVFCDGLTGGVLRDSSSDVERYRACFAALQRLALDPASSAAFFAAPSGD